LPAQPGENPALQNHGDAGLGRQGQKAVCDIGARPAGEDNSPGLPRKRASESGIKV
jgi:hypothetical protein